MATEKILVVDDDTNICELLRLYLEKEGYSVTIANTGMQAVKLFADFFKQVDIHLMIQKAVYFEDISFFNDSVFANSFFQKLHSFLLLI